MTSTTRRHLLTASLALALAPTAFAQARGAPLSERVAYSTSAMVGRLPGAGAVGEVAAAMGWLDTDSAVYEGLYGNRPFTGDNIFALFTRTR